MSRPPRLTARTGISDRGNRRTDHARRAIPYCRAYDPAFAGELAVILDHGARRIAEQGEDVFCHITVMNEVYAHPSLPSEAKAVSRSGALTREQAARGNIPVLQMQAGIHAGEIDGKDAGFLSLRRCWNSMCFPMRRSTP